jgi:hypothetical protein
MISRSWLALFVGSLVFTLSMWFALVAITGSEVVGAMILAVGLVLAVYAVAGFSGAEGPFDVGFKSSIYALVVGGVMLVASEATSNEQFLVLTPLVAVVVGGAQALAPVGNRARFLTRVTSLVPISLIAWLVFWVDPVVFAVVIPPIALVGVGLADRVYLRAKEVLAEEPPGV